MSDLFARSRWFRQDRFGMFIHWGLYAIHGRGEWHMSEARISAEEYQTYFDRFNPVDYDPKKWAHLAKLAGMKYMVLTVKHHDGFCLFDSKLTDYKSTNTLCGRDLTREFVEAARAEGLKVGLYYSLIDWHHPDYPKYNDLIHPMRGNEAYKDEKVDFDSYLRYMHGQIEELCRDYGKIDILWFDYAYENMRGEAWKAKELVEMVRRYQPDVIMDNRLETSGEGFGSLVTESPNPWSGDFVSPEQIIPAEGIRNEAGKPVPWELCTTINNNWGYNPNDADYKPASMLIRKLVECVSKNGNMILNVGPDARGNIGEASIRALEGLGDWMKFNGESIYNCGYSGVAKPEWGRYTRKGNVIYAHVLEPCIGPLALTGIDPSAVEALTLLRDGSEVMRGDSWITKAYEGTLFACFGTVPHFTYPLPDETDTVIKIVLKTPFKNAKKPSYIPTYDGTNQSTHPSVLYFKKPWNGHSYWMAMTPYPFNNDGVEDPSILASDDGIAWEVPTGVVNPLTPAPKPGHNCDTDLVFDEASGELRIYYVEADDVSQSWVKLMRSRDGVNWSKPEVVIHDAKYMYGILSPTIKRLADGKYYMWYVNTGNTGYRCQCNIVQMRSSDDGISWTEAQDCPDLKQPSWQIWHLDIQYEAETDTLHATYPAYPDGGNCDDCTLFYAVKHGKEPWKTSSKPALCPGAENAWDDFCIYRSSLLVDRANDSMKLWYGGKRKSDAAWGIGYTECSLAELSAQLGI